MSDTKSKLSYLAATFLFAAAVFLIASDSLIFGIAAFAAAVCFMCIGRKCQEREAPKKEGDGL